VEGHQQAASVPPLHRHTLHVHGRVDRTDDQAERGHREEQQGAGAGRADGEHRGADAEPGDPQHRRAAQPRRQRTGQHAAGAGDHRHGEQDQRQLTVAEPELVLQGRDPGQHRGEAETLHDVRRGGRPACPPVPRGYLVRLGGDGCRHAASSAETPERERSSRLATIVPPAGAGRKPQ
jgi:hypothetical protein